MASLGFLAAAGLLLNFAIGRVYGAQALGLFNIVFALYIFLSQLGVLGIHFSALRYISEYADHDQRTLDAIASGALMIATAISMIVTLAAFSLTPLVAYIYKIDGISTSWLIMLPGLWCFSINKVLLSIINGAEHMRAFAIFQTLRFMLVLSALAIVLAHRAASPLLFGVISGSEILLLPFLALYIRRRILVRWDWGGGRAWLARHLSFGLRVFPSGTIGELNTRVDILLLGAILNDAATGIYSVALLLAEGLAQAVVVVRTNLNPMITRRLTLGQVSELERFGRTVSKWFALFMAMAGIGLMGGFVIARHWLFASSSFDAALQPLVILLAGLIAASPYMPFGMIFSQSGHPLLQTVYSGAILTVNVVLNAILIPVVGINGAAIATASSYVATALLLIVLMRRLYNIRIWI
jgi:O-antigen/teichoic acid export membrane protein